MIVALLMTKTTFGVNGNEKCMKNTI